MFPTPDSSLLPDTTPAVCVWRALGRRWESGHSTRDRSRPSQSLYVCLARCWLHSCGLSYSALPVATCWWLSHLSDDKAESVDNLLGISQLASTGTWTRTQSWRTPEPVSFAPFSQTTELMGVLSSRVWALGKPAPNDLFPITPVRRVVGPFSVILTLANTRVTNLNDGVVKTSQLLII